MFIDGFKYWLAFKKDGKCYYRCRRHKKGCPAKMWVPDAETGPASSKCLPRPSVEHNHDAETERALVECFRKVLTRRAATEKLDLHTIYWDEATRHSEAALNYPFSPTAESAMAKARRKAESNTTSFPDVVDLDKIGEILQSSTSFRILDYGQREQFYQESISRGGLTALIFAHHATVEKLPKPFHDVQVNVTTLICSSGNYVLLTVHRLTKLTKAIPLVYVILNGQTMDLYSAIFAYIREKLGIIPSVIISDCLLDLHSSLLLTYPEASLKANWFEYVTSVSNHLVTAPRETFKDGNRQIVLRMILVLPFLPADYMAPGLEAIRKWMRDKSIDITTTGPLGTLCRHVETAWMRSIGAGKLSMFRVAISVDHMKEFHKELNLIIGTAIPSIWHVMSCLTTMASKINARLNRAAAAIPVNEKEKTFGRKHQMLSETIVRSATEQWITQPIHLRSPLQFLQMASHFITMPFLTSVVLRQRDLPETKKRKPTKRPVAKAKVAPQVKKQIIATEPPPLVYYPKVAAKIIPVIPREPPPLVPITIPSSQSSG